MKRPDGQGALALSLLLISLLSCQIVVIKKLLLLLILHCWYRHQCRSPVSIQSISDALTVLFFVQFIVVSTGRSLFTWRMAAPSAGVQFIVRIDTNVVIKYSYPHSKL